MTDWRARLREYDPAGDVPGPGRFDVMRTVIVETARSARTRRPIGAWRLAFVAGALALVGGAAGDGNGTPRPLSDAAELQAQGQRRQVQFATPGGTRIIWELNPGFSLRETLP